MFDAATTAQSSAVLDEVCESVSQREIGPRSHVASKILEAVTRGEVSQDELTQAGRDGLWRAPAMMWR
nr:hypothetical protein [Bradyrhizobium sp. 197]